MLIREVREQRAVPATEHLDAREPHARGRPR
jgi:hypothetical protein